MDGGIDGGMDDGRIVGWRGCWMEGWTKEGIKILFGMCNEQEGGVWGEWVRWLS